ncbi:hypothetical protein [Streptomyces clavuligerus]|uniref:hypothetical protein n=1 Tax=Streptomyces clavuligerus TaxID=1901 RepID=UPI00020D9577|nr:hypothetical protein [Streptomyces clavuligerus]WDN52365.1 hypothetical protein LL058_11180 [Streptomyces clavuligerus]
MGVRGPAGPLVLEPLGVPHFRPVRTRRGAHRLRRAVRRRRRTLAAGIALTAAALAASAPRAPEDRGDGGTRRAAGADDGVVPPGGTADPGPATDTGHRPGGAIGRAQRPVGAGPVTVPVRIADAETVRLLRPGDRVDVVAAPDVTDGPDGPPDALVVASCVRVAEVPRPVVTSEGGGALVVLSVPRGAAPALAVASATLRLAVAVC